MKKTLTLLLPFVAISFMIHTAGANTLTTKGAASKLVLTLPSLLTPKQALFPRLVIDTTTPDESPRVISTSSAAFTGRSWRQVQDQPYPGESAPPPQGGGYAGAQPPPQQYHDEPMSDVLFYTLVIGGVVVALVVLAILAGDGDEYDDGYKKSRLSATPRPSLFTFNF